MKLTPLQPWIQQKFVGNRSELARVEIEAWQLAKLNETLKLVRARSSFYKKTLVGMPEELTCLEEITQFPFTTAEDIRHNPFSLVCVSQDEIHRVVTLQSSGTTGEPKRIYFTAEDQELTIDFFGVGMSTLTDVGDSVLILLPGETPGSVGDLLRFGLERQGRVPIPHGPVHDPFQTIEIMKRTHAETLVGAPVQVLGLARRWKKDIYSPRSILLSTDYVPASIVREIQKVWNCEVFNHYGATEMGLGGGVECEAHCGYHLREADLYFEIINPITGEITPIGDYGEVVFSTLTRNGMPLIRYRTGDRSRFIPGNCPCGTNLRLLEKIRGRFFGSISVGEEVLKLPDLDEVLFSVPDLLNYSVKVEGDELNSTIIFVVNMLTKTDSKNKVEEALGKIPFLKSLDVIVHCQYSPQEVGNLFKRTLLDARGQYA